MTDHSKMPRRAYYCDFEVRELCWAFSILFGCLGFLLGFLAKVILG